MNNMKGILSIDRPVSTRGKFVESRRGYCYSGNAAPGWKSAARGASDI
jgi:hypothetical protein